MNYGELSGPVPPVDLHQLFTAGGVFLTKFNARAYINGHEEAATLISQALQLATKHRAVISDVAARFPLDAVADAYRALESNPGGKILVLPQK